MPGWREKVFLPGLWAAPKHIQGAAAREKRRTSAGYHHGDPTCMWYRCDSLPGPDPGGTSAIDLKDSVFISSGCSGEKICCLGGSRPCVFVNVGVRHRR